MKTTLITSDSISADMEVHHVQGNEPILLNNPNIAWRVKQGAIAIFAVHVRNGVPEGERRYLFSVDTGGTLFGYPTDDETEHLGLIAVALEPSELQPVDLDYNGPEPDLATLKAWVDPWIQQIGTIRGWPKMRKVNKPPETNYVSMMSGEVCVPKENQVLWVRMQEGTTFWMGDERFPITDWHGCFPIGHATCLRADKNVQFFARETDRVKSKVIIVKGIAQLHRYFLAYIQQLEEEELKATAQRFQQRQALNQRVTDTTIQSLATVLKVEEDDYLRVDEPLLVAAGAVGKVLGVNINPPMESENATRVKEPLEAIARASRLRMRSILLRQGWWKKDGGPILAYTRDNHSPVALLPTEDGQYELFDPVQAKLAPSPLNGASRNGSSPTMSQNGGRSAAVPHQEDVPSRTQIQLSTRMQSTTKIQPDSASHRLLNGTNGRVRVTAEVAQILEPVAYIFYRPLPDGKLSALDLLKFTFQGRRKDLVMLLITGIAATLMGMVVPQATAVLVDTAIPFGDGSLISQMGVGLLAAAFGGAAFQLAQAIATMRLETVSDTSLQAAVWDRLLKLRTTFFRQYSIGDLSSRVSGISAIRRTLSGTALQSIFSGFFALLNLGLLFYYSASLALLALGVALLVMGFTVVTGVMLVRRHKPLLAMEGELYGLIVQLVNGVPKLRIAGAEERAFAFWGQKYVQQLRLLLSTQQLEDAISVFNTVIPVLTTVALFWVASGLITSSSLGSGLTTGSFLAFNVAYGTFIGGAASLSNSILDVLEIVPIWQRSLPILQAEPEVDNDKADPGRLTGRIKVDHATFRYREDGPLILDDVTIETNPGEFIALVGPSGSGKSTIFRLLLGFETPQSGTVYFDGQELSGLDISAVRRQLGVVLQNGRISAGTIFENIAGGALISIDEAWDAAERSGLAGDVRAMPMNLHTVVSEGGGNLSGGQRQRLVIARALVLKPKILLLDEATSALDNRTQAIVSESLDRMNVTRIVVAHRLSTIRNADRIYVLEAGRVVQSGSFDELSKQDGLFAQLIKRQLA
ncbi:MAG: NHLP bacteriocin export ABC transporter permease/ATPase subunit [Leptolyngbyaceae bacterium]|nr:NHLP bacteriocin export ABC transporter permease/ATPase subunit [Leptolyngbyaceae bacterium]